MHIVYDCRWIRSLQIDGIGRYALNLLSALMTLPGEQRYTLLFHDENIQKWVLAQLPEVAEARLKTELVPFPVLSLSEFTKLPKILKKLAPDVIFSPIHLSNAYLPGAASVVTVHDLTPYLFPEVRETWRWKVFFSLPVLTRWQLRKATEVITGAACVKPQIVEYFAVPPEKITPIHHGLAERFFQPQPDDGGQALSRYGVAPTKPYLLCLGRPDPYKNVATLIEAWKSLPHALRSQHQLVLAGRPTGKSYPAGVVETGFVDEADIVRLYQDAAAFVFPTRSEGFGFPALEALAAGAPVIASSIPPLLEIGGDQFVYFNPDDPLELADCISDLLADASSKDVSKRRSRQAHARQFTWKRSAEQLMAVFERVTATPQPFSNNQSPTD